MKNLPSKLPIFPLSNFIIFPKTTVPLNIFEPRYIDMINDSMKSNKLIGMIQPKTSNIKQTKPELHEVGCLGKITSFRLLEQSSSNSFNQAAELAIRNANLNLLPEALAKNPPYIVVVRIIPPIQ